MGYDHVGELDTEDGLEQVGDWSWDGRWLVKGQDDLMEGVEESSSNEYGCFPMGGSSVKVG
jgi:hypothetical protein